MAGRTAAVSAGRVPLFNGRPIGLMLPAKHYDEASIYRTAHAFEQAGDRREM